MHFPISAFSPHRHMESYHFKEIGGRGSVAVGSQGSRKVGMDIEAKVDLHLNSDDFANGCKPLCICTYQK